MNKGGFLRIIEAVIAILIIAGVLLVVANQNKASVRESNLDEMIPPLLEEISQNATLRELIANNPEEAESDIRDFLSYRIKDTRVYYNTTICDVEEICYLESYPNNYDGEIYARERIISSTINSEADLKKVKIFLWRL